MSARTLDRSPATPASRPASVAGLGALALVLAAGCGAGGAGSDGKGLLAAPVGTGGGSTGPLVSQPFRSIIRGQSSPVASSGASIAVNAPQWDLLWPRHAGASSAPPAVGFPGEVAIGVFSSTVRGPEAVNEVVRVDRDTVSGNLVVTTRLFQKGAWRAPTTAAAPYHFVATPAPAGAARPSVRLERELRLDFEVIDAGSQSAIGAGDPTYQGELMLIEDAPSLASFYALHEPGAAVPVVDFSSEMVLAVLAGYRSSFGHSVITRAILCDETQGELRLDCEVQGYRGGAAPPRVTETPFQVLRVAKAAAHAVRAERRAALPLTAAADGDQSLHTGGLDVQVARDQASFDALVTARLGAGGYTGRAPDFTREQAVLAFAGAQPTGGYTIDVARVDLLERGEIEVRVHTMHPTGMATTALTSPFAIAIVPMTHGPVAVRVEDVTPRP